MVGHVEGQDLEVPRGALTVGLMNAVTTYDVEFLFANSVQTLVDRPQGVDVIFTDGTERTFDVVIGADGQHSMVRQLAFGPEDQFDRYMGWCFAGFTLPNPGKYHHEVIVYNKPGRFATMYAAPGADLGFTPIQAATAGGPEERVFGFLSFKSPRPTYEEARDTERMRTIVLNAYEGMNAWELPTLREGLRVADDVYADTVNQIRMPTWSKGRVAVAGDAAAAPSFLTGQGTSVALVGAYVLAKELARHDDHAMAFHAYEHAMRGFVGKNQSLVESGVRSSILERRRQIWRRNVLLRAFPLLNRLGVTNLFGARIIEASTAIDLSAYQDDLATPSTS
jgi:2-polyprenyl-6-methoxyphenol hydroxylase-like FAD-dependent oxidoreductase